MDVVGFSFVDSDWLTVTVIDMLAYSLARRAKRLLTSERRDTPRHGVDRPTETTYSALEYKAIGAWFPDCLPPAPVVAPGNRSPSVHGTIDPRECALPLAASSIPG